MNGEQKSGAVDDFTALGFLLLLNHIMRSLHDVLPYGKKQVSTTCVHVMVSLK